MTAPSKHDIASLKASGLFDEAWYRSAYPDVDALRMDQAEHYLKYGRFMGRMSADGETADILVLERLDRLPVPKPGSALLEAEKISRSGDGALAVAYARRYVPPEFDYTIHALKANIALSRKDEARWLHHLNAYLENSKISPILLGSGSSLLDRLCTAMLPAVTGGPLVTVIMPAWNAEATVAAAARSVLNQTWKNLELIIIDDCSEDATWSVLQGLAACDSRVKLIRNTINVGPYVSKNLALREAKGEWITGHDADDWAHPQRIEQHLCLAQQSSADASITHMVRVEVDGRLSQIGASNSFSFDGVSRKALISCLFCADVLRKHLGFWDSVRFGADSEMIARAEKLLANRFSFFRKISMICLDIGTSLTNHPEFGLNRAGLSSMRQSYKQSWTEWHDRELTPDTAYLPFSQSRRRYTAHADMVVDVSRCLESAREASYDARV